MVVSTRDITIHFLLFANISWLWSYASLAADCFSPKIDSCSQVLVTAFKDTPKLLKIMSTIMVSRDSQKGIVIGAKVRVL